MGSPPPGGKPGVKIHKNELKNWKKQLEAIVKRLDLYIRSADY